MVEPLDIKPGIGIGSAVLGLSRDEIREVFGKPESIDHEDYGDGSSSETWFYFGGDLSMTFCSDEGHRLTFVSVDLEDALLENQSIVGLPEGDLSKQLASHCGRGRPRWSIGKTDADAKPRERPIP